MNTVQIEQKSYEMRPRDGFTVTHFLTVADIDRSARFYEKVFGGRILSRGDSKGPGTFRSRIRGSLSTSGAGRPPISRR
jgi:predicted enzyme related to lactoylglutathione lyase